MKKIHNIILIEISILSRQLQPNDEYFFLRTVTFCLVKGGVIQITDLLNLYLHFIFLKM